MSNLSFTSKTFFTGILLMYPLYQGQEVPCNMLSYLFSCCEAIPTLPVPLFILLPVYSCVLSVHIPKSPAEIQSHRFWTLIIFFWLENFQPNFGKSLRYMYISFCESLLRNCTATKKSIFYEHGLLLLLLFVCLACPWPASTYVLRTLADTTLIQGCWCWLINYQHPNPNGARNS